MKARLLAMGSIISILTLTLLASKGFSPGPAGLLGVGVALLALGILWK